MGQMTGEGRKELVVALLESAYPHGRTRTQLVAMMPEVKPTQLDNTLHALRRIPGLLATDDGSYTLRTAPEAYNAKLLQERNASGTKKPVKKEVSPLDARPINESLKRPMRVPPLYCALCNHPFPDGESVDYKCPCTVVPDVKPAILCRVAGCTNPVSKEGDECDGLVSHSTELESKTESDTQAEGRVDCPVIGSHCQHYGYQLDSNGEVAIEHCAHPEHPEPEHEGNVQFMKCPLMPSPAKPLDQLDPVAVRSALAGLQKRLTVTPVAIDSKELKLEVLDHLGRILDDSIEAVLRSIAGDLQK